jgi:hypothetical protein
LSACISIEFAWQIPVNNDQYRTSAFSYGHAQFLFRQQSGEIDRGVLQVFQNQLMVDSAASSARISKAAFFSVRPLLNPFHQRSPFPAFAANPNNVHISSLFMIFFFPD